MQSSTLMTRSLLAPDFKYTAIGGKKSASIIRTILLSIGSSFCCYWCLLAIVLQSTYFVLYKLLFFRLAFPAKIETAVILFAAFGAVPRLRWFGVGKLVLDDCRGLGEILVVSNPELQEQIVDAMAGAIGKGMFVFDKGFDAI